jgi:hypothetical protein
MSEFLAENYISFINYFFYFLSNVDAQNMLVGGGTSGASGSGTAGEAPPAAGPPV